MTSLPRTRLLRAATVAVPGILSAVCCLFVGMDQSLWFDEEYSVVITQQSVGRMVALTAVDVHPPLYYLLLKAWGTLFAWNDTALRALSCLFTGLSVAVFMLLIARLFGWRTARIASPILVFAPFMLRYGYEIRMYALSTLLAAFGTYALVRALGLGTGEQPAAPDRMGRRNRIIWWAVYTVTVALGMYTLYLSVLIWATHALWLVVRSWRNRPAGSGVISGIWHADWRWIGAYLCSIVLYIPWLPVLLKQAVHPALPVVTQKMNMATLASTYTAWIVDAEEKDLPAIASILLLALLIALIAMGVRLCGRLDRARRGGLLLLAALFLLPMVMMMGASAISGPSGNAFYMLRYASVPAPFFYATVAVIVALSVDGRGTDAHDRTDGGSDTSWRLFSRVTGVLAVLALLVGVGVVKVRGNYGFERGSRPEAAALSERVQCDASHPVVAANEYFYIDAYYYYRDCSGYRFFAPEDVSTTGGYAPLHGSPAQLRDFDDLDAESFTLLTERTDDGPPLPVPDGDYQVVDSFSVGPAAAVVYRKVR